MLRKTVENLPNARKSSTFSKRFGDVTVCLRRFEEPKLRGRSNKPLSYETSYNEMNS